MLLKKILWTKSNGGNVAARLKTDSGTNGHGSRERSIGIFQKKKKKLSLPLNLFTY